MHILNLVFSILSMFYIVIAMLTVQMPYMESLVAGSVFQSARSVIALCELKSGFLVVQLCMA